MPTRPQFIDAIVESGLELLGRRARDPARLKIINALADLGEELLDAHAGHLRTFEEEFIKEPNRLRWELLGRTALERKELSAEQSRQLDILGIEPDLLAPLQRLRKETSHTQVLAWALSPTTKRWLKADPLEALLRRVDARRADLEGVEEIEELWSVDELTSARVRAEHHLTGYGRADISIELPRAFVLVEVKIDAEERPDQIADYHAAAAAAGHRTGKKPVVVFLTADATAEPSKPTPHLTFDQLLRDWLPVAATFDSPEHRYLGSYLASIARVVDVGDVGTFDDWNFARRRRAIDFLKVRNVE